MGLAVARSEFRPVEVADRYDSRTAADAEAPAAAKPPVPVPSSTEPVRIRSRSRPRVGRSVPFSSPIAKEFAAADAVGKKSEAVPKLPVPEPSSSDGWKYEFAVARSGSRRRHGRRSPPMT